MDTKSRYHVPERFLRQLWKYQQFDTTKLSTTSGQPLEIISPGVLNQDGGPDFTGACCRISGIVFRGDVEIHEDESEWLAHRHHDDSKYNGVILHVVLFTPSRNSATLTSSRRAVPVLALERYFTDSYRQAWHHMILNERSERLSTIPCAARSAGIGADGIRACLVRLGHDRIELKVQRYEERLRELVEEGRMAVSERQRGYDDVPFGINPEDLPPPESRFTQQDFGPARYWIQLVYEGAMEALGYSKNQPAFLNLARNVRLDFLASLPEAGPGPDGCPAVEAALFGVAGLLPVNTRGLDRAGRIYVRDLQRRWKTIRPMYHRELMPVSQWQFFRLRPENFPTIRIAGAAGLVRQLSNQDFFRTMIRAVRQQDDDPESRAGRIAGMFHIRAAGYWTRHFRFGDQPPAPNRMLVGRQRAGEIVLNVVIPVALLYARIFRDREVRAGAMEIFDSIRPPGPNTITRKIDAGLIRRRFPVDTAAVHQGAIQLYKYYCMEERCGECAVGKELGQAP